MNWRRALVKRFTSSIFAKLLLSYAFVIIICIGVFGVIQNVYFVGIIRKNLFANNNTVLQTLEDQFEDQITRLKLTLHRFYSVRINNDELVYDQIAKYMDTGRNLDLMTENRNLYNYLTMNEQPYYNDVAQFIILSRDKPVETGLSFSSLYPEYPLDYIKKIEPLIEAGAPDINRDNIYFMPALEVGNSVNSAKFYVIYDYLRKPKDPGAFIGYVVTIYPFSNFDTLLKENTIDTGGEFLILDKNGQTLYATPGAAADPMPLFSQVANKDRTQLDQNSRLVSSIRNSKYGFYVVSVTQKSTLYAGIRRQYSYMMLMAAGFAVIAFLFTMLSSRGLSIRMNRIIASIQVLEGGNFESRAPVSARNDEFDKIASTFNELTDKLNDYIQRHYRDELRNKNALIKQREAAMKALQAQINPHFLYNTLEIIRMNAVAEQEGETAYAIQILGALFKSRIKTDMYVTIREELLFCQNLLLIYNMKFGGEIEVDIRTNAEAADFAVPKDLLQPLVENVIVHAFPNTGQPDKRIAITAETDSGGDISITIADNGCGFMADDWNERLAAAGGENEENDGLWPTGSHIGLLNVQRRIRLTYGDSYGLHITGGELTRVTVKIARIGILELKKKMGAEDDPDTDRG